MPVLVATHGPHAHPDGQQFGYHECAEQRRDRVTAPNPCQRFAQRMRQAKAQQPEAPQDGGQQVLRQAAQELDLEAQEAPGAKFPP